MKQINVKKRNGSLEPWTDSKINQVVLWAGEGLDVSASQVILGAKLKITDGVETKELHEALVQSAADLISLEKPDYEKLAARLLLFGIRKEVYGDYKPCSLYETVTKNVLSDRYCSSLLEMYTEEEFNELDKIIDHSRDLDIGYAGMVQLETKYLVQDRVNNQLFESPQVLYMLVGATLFGKYPKAIRYELVKKFYHLASEQYISLPTPIMAGVRTSTRQFSSCVLIEIEDSIRGIGAATTAVMQYIAMRAGIGFNFGGIRAKGSSIRDGSVKHTG